MKLVVTVSSCSFLLKKTFKPTPFPWTLSSYQLRSGRIFTINKVFRSRINMYIVLLFDTINQCRYSVIKEECITYLLWTACNKYIVVLIALICVIYPVYIIILLYDEKILCVIVYKLSRLLFCFCFNIKRLCWTRAMKHFSIF